IEASSLRSIDIGDSSFPSPYSNAIERFFRELPFKVSNGSVIVVDREGRLNFEEQDELIEMIKERGNRPFLLLDSDPSSLEPSVFLRSLPCHRGLLPSSSIPHSAFTCNLPSHHLSPLLPFIRERQGDSVLFPLFASAHSTKPQEKEEEEEDEEEERRDGRLPCKYRKSCYESGRLPEIKEVFTAPVERNEEEDEEEE
ncbi:hypothetical protein PMAYCL1PPCAC_12682, partial [Pristionchus mayeri]